MTEHKIILDLRSDTVTQPSLSMREAMARAEVGDDGFREDPSVNALEDRAAATFGKEAALFFPSGTMANQIAIRSLAESGSLLIGPKDLHIVTTEREATTQFSGFLVYDLPESMRATGADLGAALTRASKSGVLVLENTVNLAGGAVLPFTQFQDLVQVAKANQIPVHLDGARIFNCAKASDCSVKEWAAPVDTVQFCLSKGLGAPVGSLLVGSREVIDRGRQLRQAWGGRMRQGGILAAAGLFAVENNVERLVLDHIHAQALATEFLNLDFVIDPWPQTNIVHFRPVPLSAEDFVKDLSVHGIRMLARPGGYVRAVTHLDIRDKDLPRIIEAVRRVRDRYSPNGDPE